MREIRNTTAAVVGGAGFLGSHLVEHLIYDRNCEVVVLDNLCVGRTSFLPLSDPRCEFIHCDITKSEGFLKNVFAIHGVKYVFNYAAWPYIPDSFDRPLHVFDVNANGAMNVINAAHEAGCEAILQVSSAEIYGEGQRSEPDDPMGAGDFCKIDENCQVRPHSTYGVAKAAVDYYCQAAWKERQTPVISLRQFNCIGERETHPYVVPEIISQLYSQRKSTKATVRLGNNSFRDFQYAKDAVVMATELLEKGGFGEVYNMGSEVGIKIFDLGELIGSLMGFSSVVIEQDPARVRPWEIWHLQADNTKLYSTIQARPRVTFVEALQRTINDYATSGYRWSWE